MGEYNNELSEMIDVFCTLCGVQVTRIFAIFKIQWISHLRLLYFILCKFYLHLKELSLYILYKVNCIYSSIWGFTGGLVVKNPPANAGDMSSVPGSGRSSEEGNGIPLLYSYLENSMDRGAWRAMVHGVARVRHNLMTK